MEGSSGAARAALTVALVLSAAVGWATISFRELLVPEPQITDRPIQVAEDGYASSQACKTCHPSQYETWHSSYHRTMTQVATPETVAADFDTVQVNQVRGAPMLLERQKSQFWAEFDDPDSVARGQTPRRIKRQVVMITGSHNQQVYWFPTGQGRVLGQLPAIYVTAEHRWIPRRAAVLHAPEQQFTETGSWNGICIACHATHGKSGFDTPFGSQPIQSQSVDTTAAEFGISCEACHGPSEQHARLNRGPMRRYWFHLTGRPDPTTVQPVRLQPRLSSQVCGQCHGIWEFYDRGGERQANSGGLPYRPGDELAKTRFVAQPTVNSDAPTMKSLLAADGEFVRDSFWPDGMVRVSGREYNGLVESPCFRNAMDEKRTLTCFSCHTMHKAADDPRPLKDWADDQLVPGMDGNDACLQCHQSFREKVTAHTKHAAGSPGSSCYNCHMPYTTYGLLKTIRSHTISTPSVAESVDSGRPNACNLCHLDKPLAWTADALTRQYGTTPVPLSGDDQRTAASLLWLLRGDAGQRAIIAQAMAWPPAQQISGTGWMAPYVAQLLDDPYDAVRLLASRSLRTLPAFGDFQYDAIAPSRVRREAQLRAMAVWDRTRIRPGRPDPQLLLTGDAGVDVEAVLRLLKQRNTRPVLLRE